MSELSELLRVAVSQYEFTVSGETIIIRALVLMGRGGEGLGWLLASHRIDTFHDKCKMRSPFLILAGIAGPPCLLRLLDLRPGFYDLRDVGQ